MDILDYISLPELGKFFIEQLRVLRHPHSTTSSTGPCSLKLKNVENYLSSIYFNFMKMSVDEQQAEIEQLRAGSKKAILDFIFLLAASNQYVELEKVRTFIATFCFMKRVEKYFATLLKIMCVSVTDIEQERAWMYKVRKYAGSFVEFRQFEVSKETLKRLLNIDNWESLPFELVENHELELMKDKVMKSTAAKFAKFRTMKKLEDKNTFLLFQTAFVKIPCYHVENNSYVKGYFYGLMPGNHLGMMDERRVNKSKIHAPVPISANLINFEGEVSSSIFYINDSLPSNHKSRLNTELPNVTNVYDDFELELPLQALYDIYQKRTVKDRLMVILPNNFKNQFLLWDICKTLKLAPFLVPSWIDFQDIYSELPLYINTFIMEGAKKQKMPHNDVPFIDIVKGYTWALTEYFSSYQSLMLERIQNTEQRSRQFIYPIHHNKSYQKQIETMSFDPTYLYDVNIQRWMSKFLNNFDVKTHIPFDVPKNSIEFLKDEYYYGVFDYDLETIRDSYIDDLTSSIGKVHQKSSKGSKGGILNTIAISSDQHSKSRILSNGSGVEAQSPFTFFKMNGHPHRYIYKSEG